MNDEQRLAEKVLLYLGDGPEHAIMTFAEDGSTFQELIDLAKKVQDSRQSTLPLTGVDLIAAERKRQIEQEGRTPEHDDQHAEGELVVAAACYAVADISGSGSPEQYRVVDDLGDDAWPWSKEWDKRTKHDLLRRSVIAGALIAAEIDRLIRNGWFESDEPVEPDRNQWYGVEFCPHPGAPCIDGCSLCGARLAIDDHNHTRSSKQSQPERYECVCFNC